MEEREQQAESSERSIEAPLATAPQSMPLTGGIPAVLWLQRHGGNRAVGQALARQPRRGGPRVLARDVKDEDVVLALGVYEREFPLPGGSTIRANAKASLLNEAKKASGLRAIAMTDMTEANKEAFWQQAPSGLASGTVVQEALEGGGRYRIRAIYLNTADVNLMDRYPPGTSEERKRTHPEGTNQTAAEYRAVVAAMAANNNKVDIYIQHARGLSKVPANGHVVEGADLPKEVWRFLPMSFLPATVAEALKKLEEMRDRLRREVELMEGENRQQKENIEDPSYSGFWGYWTNKLSHTYPPDLSIWNDASLALMRAKAAINAKQPEVAAIEIAHARRGYLKAMRTYLVWKDGLQGAATKMYVAIGAVAAAAIAAFVAPAAIARLATKAPNAAAGATEAEQLLVRVVQVIERADKAIVAAEEAEILAAEAEELELLQRIAK